MNTTRRTYVGFGHSFFGIPLIIERCAVVPPSCTVRLAAIRTSLDSALRADASMPSRFPTSATQR